MAIKTLFVECNTRGRSNPWKDIMPRPMEEYFCSSEEFERTRKERQIQERWRPDEAFKHVEQEQRKKLKDY